MIDRESTPDNQMYLNRMLIIVTILLTTTVSGLEADESITINKPVMRAHQPWVHFSTAYVRCFCNLPACVTTGYMCKSSGGGCFSDLWGSTGSPLSYGGRHGCLELLIDNDQRKRCRKSPDSTNLQKEKINPKNVVHCCYHDMCNHVDSPQTKNLINNTLSGGESDRVEVTTNLEPMGGYTNSEVWFRAATIAVPICGAVILFVLIALAIKILRNERQNSPNNKLGHSMYVHQIASQGSSCEKYVFDNTYDNSFRKQYSPTNHIYRHHMSDLQRIHQVPLLVQNEVTNYQHERKNDTNAKLNQINCDNLQDYLESGMLDIEKNVAPQCCSQSCNVDKNINRDMKFSDIKYGDKDYAKDDSVV